VSCTVVVRLLGGLGNQLFQWAAGAAVAREANAELRVDARLLPSHIKPRLGELGLHASEWTSRGAVSALLRAPGLWRFCRRTGLRPRVGRTRLIFDRLRGYDPSLAQCVPDDGTLVLTGYWQAPEWAESIADTLRPIVKYSKWDAIGIHVRRGDYAADARVRAYHGVLDGAYYQRALAALGSDATRRQIVVFTDDPARVRAEGWLPAQAELAAGTSDIEHLSQMAGCAHLICANSSFSWWAGWFGERAGRVVVAPSAWWSPSGGAIPHPAPTNWRRV